MQLGASNRPNHALLSEIQWIAASGFDYVHLRVEAPEAAIETTNWMRIAEALRETGIGVVCQAANYLPIENPSPLVRQSALDEIRRTIDIANRLDASLCIVDFRGWPHFLRDVDGYSYYQQLLNIAVQHGQQAGIPVALQNSPENRHQLKYFREIFHRVSDLRFTFNAAHQNIGAVRNTTRDYMFALGDRLALVQMSDNDGVVANYLPFGAPVSGGIQLQEVVQSIQNFGFDGPITVEVMGERRWLLASAALLRDMWKSVATG